MTRRRFFAILAAAAFAAAASAVAPRSHGAIRGPSLAARCGGERWPVKTLTDKDAGSVRLVPVASSVRALRRVPKQHLTAARLPGVERHVYKVRARLVAAKAEADSDVHLILADPRTGGTMIAELPSSFCTIGAPAALRARMAAARAAFDRACGVASTHYVDLHGVGDDSNRDRHREGPPRAARTSRQSREARATGEAWACCPARPTRARSH